jgi:hypothetical protein
MNGNTNENQNGGTQMNAETTKNALAVYKGFEIPELVNTEATEEAVFTDEELSEGLDGLDLSLKRIKIPAGGIVVFEIPGKGEDTDNPEYIKNIEGVIVHHHLTNAYWTPGSENDKDAVPLCSSPDGKCGLGEPGGDCATCGLNKFGSDENGTGKACKNMRALYILQNGDFMPTIILLPPTSLTPYKKFFNDAFLLRGRTPIGSIVEIGLKKMTNGTNEYSIATFKNKFDFSGEQLAKAKNYSKNFKGIVNRMNQSKLADTVTRMDDYIHYNTPGGTINGDEEDLPA